VSPTAALYTLGAGTINYVVEQPEFLNLQQAAELLQTTPRTLRRWVALGKVPNKRIGRKLLFSREALRRLVDPPE
jgi:excisionase family DNA binding protein